MSKVHVLYFAKDPDNRIWNPNEILELSDRASIYFDPRTMAKEDNKGMRVPMDVWYGKYWGRIQGNNKERRHNHHNQIPEVYLERVIKACSNPGSLVLDPFCGSGTTSTVARALGRRSITIEYSELNAKSAWDRITNIGMIPREDAGKPQSTAIFGSRRKRQPAKT
jgi:DNA modification methylase